MNISLARRDATYIGPEVSSQTRDLLFGPIKISPQLLHLHISIPATNINIINIQQIWYDYEYDGTVKKTGRAPYIKSQQLCHLCYSWSLASGNKGYQISVWQ